MIEIVNFRNLRQIKEYDNNVYLHWENGYIYLWKNNDLKLIIDKNVNSFVKFNDKLFFNTRPKYNEIFIIEDKQKKTIFRVNDDETLSLSTDCLINSKLSGAITKKGDFIPYSGFLIDNNFNIEEFNPYNRFDVKVVDLYFNYGRNKVFAYSTDMQLVYDVDITNFGRNIAKDPKTGAVLWDKPNEIKEALLADDKNIYVPLTGGQLLALDAKTGKKVWMWEQPRNGTFAIQGEYIYKQDGLTVFEIDTNTGKLIREKNFNDDVLVERFHASGSLWVYENLIIVCDVLYGKICLLNRQTLEVEEFFSLDKKLVNSKDAIIWNDNKLYVLDIDHTLHIFEKQKNTIA